MKHQNVTQVNELMDKIEQLEIKISFQEHSIEELNDAVTKQQESIDKLSIQLSFLVDKLRAMAPENIASSSEETPPPHY